MKANIYIVEDHPLVRGTLTEAIAQMEGLSICGEAATAAEALEKLADAGPDLTLVDMSLPGMDGAELIREIGARWPALPCLVLSGHEGATYVKRAMEAGARGYVLKRNPYELEEAIRRVLLGEQYLSTSLA